MNKTQEKWKQRAIQEITWNLIKPFRNTNQFDEIRRKVWLNPYQKAKEIYQHLKQRCNL